MNQLAHTKERIIYSAVTKLNEETKLKCTFNSDFDLLRFEQGLESCANTTKEFFSIFFISKLLERNVDWVGKQVKSKEKTTIVMSKYISYKVSSILYEKGIQYLDAAGNCYLKTRCALIHFKGFKLSENDNYIEERNIAFSTKGLMVVFLYLSNYWFANLTVRQIEKLSGVSRGTVSLVNRNLLKLGFFCIEDQEFRLVNRSKLFEKWAVFFNDKLKYKLIIGRYRTEELDFWEKAKEDREVISGEVGAVQIFPEINATTGIVYTSNQDDLISRYKLVEADSGDIELRRKFWDDSESSNYKVDIRLLIYTDVVLGYNLLNKKQVNTLRTMIEGGIGVTH